MNIRRLVLIAACLPCMALAGGGTLSPMAAAAREAVLRQLGATAANASLDVVAAPRPGKESGISYRVRAVEGRFPRARFTVTVDAYRDGHLVGSHPVAFALSQRGPGLVYRHAEHAGVAADMVDTDTTEIDSARATGIVRNLAEEEGMRLRHSVRAGAPVLASDFEAVPDVDNRSTVRLQATFGAITVESPATAMRSGNRGDKVPVMVSGASGPVTALVVDKGVTRIEQ